MNDILGQPLAYGRTAEIYAWGPGQVLKLFYDWYDPESVEYEARIARAIQENGLPVPAIGEILRVNGRLGLVYQRVDGPSLWEEMMRRPWLVMHYARQMAALHIRMHANPGPTGIPDQHDRLERKIMEAKGLPEMLKRKGSATLASMPPGDRLCHGDFHPFNILMAATGEVVIDWIDATRGNPLADVARTSILVTGAIEAGQIKGAWPRLLLQLMHSAYLDQYFQLRPGGREEYRRWLPIVAAARVSEGILELEDWLIAQAAAL